VLQERQVRPLGSNQAYHTDTRFLAASNRNLKECSEQGTFRADLYYRLNVITIQVPPLRERHEDVPLLAQHFLRVYAAKNNRQLDGFTDEALGCLEAYSWPGNVRELENVVERAVVLARGLRVDAGDLTDAVRERSVMLVRSGTAGAPGAGAVPEGVFQVRVGTPLAEVEARLLEETLRMNHGNKTLTAKMLGIDPKTVFRKLKQGETDEPAPGDAPVPR
jgi:two-component system response regulator HydG